MEIGLISIIVVIVLLPGSIVGARIGVAAPLILILLGIGIGYLPFMPSVVVSPEIILVGVLPPLLYAAAVNVPLIDFRRNFRPVIGLSVVLVIITTLVVGLTLHWAVPQVPLPVAFALGAVISPTDAVAATAIGKRLGMPDRIVSILEGESLVNDATSLVLLKTALIALSGSFAFMPAVGMFSYSVATAVLIGFCIGIITVWVRSKFKNPVYDTVVSFAVPFLAFIPAEELGASGVLAVVVTGLYTGHHATMKFSAIARTNERLNWRTIQFVLDNGVFLLMGLELHGLVDRVGDSDFHLDTVILVSFVLVGVLIGCRALFVVPTIWIMRRTARRIEYRSRGLGLIVKRMQVHSATTPARLSRTERMAQRSAADAAHERDAQLGWRDGMLLSWTGMRGVVTLAAAQSIPTEVPFREQIVLTAFIVATVTLLFHGLTLPALIRRLWPEGVGGNDRSELAVLCRDLMASGINAIDDEIEKEAAAGGPTTPEFISESARVSSKNALATLAIALNPMDPNLPSTQESPAEAYLRLANVSLEAQRAALLEERAIGRYSSRALQQVSRALDAHENRLTPPAEH